MFERIRNFEFNFFQSISLTGLVVSIFAQTGLFLLEKKVEHFWWVYIIWVVVFVVSSFFPASDPHDHHHHDH